MVQELRRLRFRPAKRSNFRMLAWFPENGTPYARIFGRGKILPERCEVGL